MLSADQEGTALSGHAAELFSLNTSPLGINVAISTSEAKVPAGTYPVFIEAKSPTGATAYKSMTLTLNEHPCTLGELLLEQDEIASVHIDELALTPLPIEPPIPEWFKTSVTDELCKITSFETVFNVENVIQANADLAGKTVELLQAMETQYTNN